METLARVGCLSEKPEAAQNEQGARVQMEEQDDPLEVFLTSHEEKKKEGLTAEVMEKLKNLSDSPRLKLVHGQNIIQHWFELTKMDQDLWSVVSVILAAPATQVSVERAFSALAIILSKLRSRLSEETLHDILIVKLNIDLCS